MLSVVSFHTEPVGRGDHDQNLSAARQSLQCARGVKRRRLQGRSRRLHDSLNLLLEGVHALFETHRGSWFNGSWFNALRRNRRWLADFWTGRRLDRGLGVFVLERNLLFPRRGFLLCFSRLGRLGL